MKKLFFFLVVMMMASSSFAQIVPSSCTAPDSIVKKYKEDADRLAVRKFFRRNYTEKDSVIIPKVHSDTVLNALLAVYNATSFPARDTVVGMYNVHTQQNPTLRYLTVYAGNGLSWMQQLQLGIIPTSTPSVDSIIAQYGLIINSFMALTTMQEVVFKTDTNNNTIAIGNQFMSVQPVGTNDGIVIGGGNEITDSITANHVEIIYSIGWGDCPSGCNCRRYFQFNVYYDCSVEFKSSWGCILPPTSIEEIPTSTISLFPNPTTGNITINGITQPSVAVYNLMGQKVVASQGSNEVSLAHLPAGMYLVQVFNKDGELVKSEKIMRQ